MSVPTIDVGDCREVLATYDEASFHAIVTDPPYELGFMGKSWDSAGVAFDPETWAACLRVLRPGGYLLAFGGSRTFHRIAVAIEDAGFEIRDTIMWVYGSGFPKSRDIGREIDKRAGVEREVIGTKLGMPGYSLAEGPDNAIYGKGIGGSGDPARECEVTAPATDAAKKWDGWGTALKPAHEPIIVARKPLDGTIYDNIMRHECGGLNIDGCRIAAPGGSPSQERRTHPYNSGGTGSSIVDRTSPERKAEQRPGEALGRWPANVILTHAPGCVQKGVREVKASGEHHEHHERSAPGGNGVTHGQMGGVTGRSYGEGGRELVEAWECEPGCPVAAMDDQSGSAGAQGKASGPTHEGRSERGAMAGHFNGMGDREPAFHDDQGGASRFFLTTPAAAEDEYECVEGCPVAIMDEQSGDLPGGGFPGQRHSPKFGEVYGDFDGSDDLVARRMEGGGASRFFYVAKASDAERNAGLAGMPEQSVFKDQWESLNNPRCLACGLERIARHTGTAKCECEVPEWAENRDKTKANYHPTVKPIDLMRWLVRLVTPDGGRVLDPFSGSGTTLCAAVLEGVEAHGVELGEDFAEIARRRVAWWASMPTGIPTEKAVEGDKRRRAVESVGQEGLF